MKYLEHKLNSPFNHYSFLKDFDDLFDNFLTSKKKETHSFKPLTDIKEYEDLILLSFDLPGVEEKNINIEIKDSILHVSGHREEEKSFKEHNFRRIERFTGDFSRSFTLPDSIDSSKIEAQFTNGVLNLALPKVNSVEKKKISISNEKTGLFSKLTDTSKNS